MVSADLFSTIVEELDLADEGTYRKKLLNRASDMFGKVLPDWIVTAGKETYMLPGSATYKAGLVATQYGDFIARYILYHYDVDVRGKDPQKAINESLATFIYYNIPQDPWLQFLNDNGLAWFTKWYLRGQHVIVQMFHENPVSATGVFMLQKALLPSPLSDNMLSYALLDNVQNKIDPFPLDRIDAGETAWPNLFDWILHPLGGSGE